MVRSLKHLLVASLSLGLLFAGPAFPQAGGGGQGDGGTGVDSPDQGINPPPSGRGPEFEAEAVPSWSTWWTLNQEHFLDLRTHVHATGQKSDYDDGFFVGQGWRRQEKRSVLQPSAADVAETVLPLLEKTLAEDRSTPVQRACLIALARAVRTQDQGEQIRILAVLQPHLRDANAEVAEAAVLAMGILGHFTGASPLAEILGDTEAGRRLVGRGEVPYRTRAFAAYALGLLGAHSTNEDVRRYVVHHLARAMPDDRGRWKDLEVACILAMGMVPLADRGEELIEAEAPLPPGTSRAGQIRFLLDLYQDATADRLARAHAADAIGRLFAALSAPRREQLKPQIALPLLHEIRRGSDPLREILQSTVLALGSIGDDDDDPTDREIRRSLLRLEELHRDREARNFALLSLARTGARAGIGKNPGGGLASIQRQLVTELIRGSVVNRPWAALSMGVLARGLRARGMETPPELAAAVRSALKSSRSPHEAGAYCLAAGLIGDPGAVPHLERHLVKTKNDAVRSYAAVGLALVPAKEKAEVVDMMLEEAKHRPSLVESLAVAKALLDDREAVHEIATLLAEAQSFDSKIAFLIALGRVGDVRALDPLVAMLSRPTMPTDVRAVAVTALGMVVEPESLPWPTVVATGVNFVAPTETLLSRDGRGILEAR